MSKPGFTRLTVWIMAALVAVVMSFVATTAQAHPGHEHRQMAAAAVPAPVSIHGQNLVASEPTVVVKMRLQAESSRYASFDAPPKLRHGQNGVCACCAGASCCSLSCLPADARALGPPAAFVVRLAMPPGRSPAGRDPATLLRPPRIFA